MTEYNFIALGTIMGVAPYFFQNGDQVLSDAYDDFLLEREALLEAVSGNKPHQVAAAMGALKQRLSPNLMGYQLVNQTQRTELRVGDAPYEIEMWWPRKEDKLAQPCCAVFVLRDAAQHIHVRFTYRPNAFVIDANNPDLCLLAVTHEPRMEGKTVTAVDVHLDPMPEQANRLQERMQIIQFADYGKNAALDAQLHAAREILGGEAAPDNAALAALLSLLNIAAPSPAISLRFSQRGTR